MALLPVMAPDLLEPQKRAIDERIRDVAAASGLAVQAESDTAQGIAEAKGAGAACNIESLACQAQMGVLLGVKHVLVARVSSDWAGDRFELRMLDALRGSTIRETSQPLPKDAAARDRVLHGAILRVLAPEKTGSLLVQAPPGSPLLVDGVSVATTERETRVDGLVPAVHHVELRADGRAAETVQVTVGAGALATVAIGVEAPGAAGASATSGTSGAPGTPDPAAGGGALGPWLLGGGAALAAASGAAAGALQATLEYTAMERQQRSALQVTGITLLGSTAVGILVAGAGGVLMLGDAP